MMVVQARVTIMASNGLCSEGFLHLKDYNAVLMIMK